MTRPAALFAVTIGLALATEAASPPPAFRRSDWLADFQFLKSELERSYSHLAWLGSPQSGVNLPALHREALQALQRSSTDAEATAAINHFLEGFHDAHLSKRSWAAAAPAPVPEPTRPTTWPDAKTACAALGYVPSSRVQFSLPFETLPGFVLESDGLADAFRAGVIESGGRRLGLLRIQKFRASDFAPLCVQAWTRVRAKDGGASAEDVSGIIDHVFLEQLAQRLARFRALRVDAVVVDLGGNTGGNDLADWSVRAFTEKPITSAPLLVNAGDAGALYLDEQLGGMRKSLTSYSDLPEPTRGALEDGVARFEERKAAIAKPQCEMSWVWKEQRPWSTSPCTRLIAADFFSGPVGYVDAGTWDPRAASSLYWATAADFVRGAWTGKTYVLTNDQTASAAEAFATLIRDRGVARTIGEHTAGAGCGFMESPPPVVLPHSHLSWSLPNCVRLRDDGTDDVAGLSPDLPIAALPGESARARAARVLSIVAKELAP